MGIAFMVPFIEENAVRFASIWHSREKIRPQSTYGVAVVCHCVRGAVCLCGAGRKPVAFARMTVPTRLRATYGIISHGVVEEAPPRLSATYRAILHGVEEAPPRQSATYGVIRTSDVHMCSGDSVWQQRRQHEPTH